MSQNKEQDLPSDLVEHLTDTTAGMPPVGKPYIKELLMSRGNGHRRVSASTCLQMVKRQEDLEAHTVKKIVSGGQTGVDRAALDTAMEMNVPVGGWCPKGRKAEDGPIDDRYPLKETNSSDYETRTMFNVRDSHGTLILTKGTPTGGTALTIKRAKGFDKDCLIIGDVRSAL